MPTLQNRRILLGISGGIAAYKTAELVRLLKKSGAEVKVVMTPAAQAFITPLTLQALSGNPVHLDMLDTNAEAAMGHIELARWAELLIVAPATADFIAKLSAGLANDLLSTLCLATKAPIALAPSMNQQMWANAATKDNITTLQSRSTYVWGPAEGEQACGDIGKGRMLEPNEITEKTHQFLQDGPLKGKKVVITAGPTQEPLDPVRYISNHSSGKMGYALAQAALEAGAKTILISGPTALTPPTGATIVSVTTAQQMLEAAIVHTKGSDIFIAAAAVADYRPKNVSEQKIKKSEAQTVMTLELEQNPDIVATIARLSPKPYTVGFAAETTNIIEYAKNKLKNKKLDLIIANDVSNASIGFNSNYNAVTIIDRFDHHIHIEISQKNKLARDIIQNIAIRMEDSLRTEV